MESNIIKKFKTRICKNDPLVLFKLSMIKDNCLSSYVEDNLVFRKQKLDHKNKYPINQILTHKIYPGLETIFLNHKFERKIIRKPSCIVTKYYRDGVYHTNNNFPSISKENIFSKEITSKKWHRDGKYFRKDNLPHHEERGNSYFIEYSQEGEYVKSVKRNSNGNIIKIKFKINNKYHNIDSPSKIEFEIGGSSNVKRFYYKDNEIHREDGPAVIYSYIPRLLLNPNNLVEGEKINIEKYYINGNLHRLIEDGPAVVNHRNSKYNRYYLEGKYIK